MSIFVFDPIQTFDMRIVFLFLTALFLQNTVYSQSDFTKPDAYYDLVGNEISKKEFETIRKDHRLFFTIIDSLNAWQLWNYRVDEMKKTQFDFQGFTFELSEKANIEIPDSEILVIVFYQGPDPCSTSGTSTGRSERNWYRDLAKKANKIADTEFLYFYRNDKLLKTKRLLPWQQDPDGFIEKLFFKKHYPCSGTLVLSKSGEYIGVWSEATHDYVLDAIRELKK